MEVVGWCLGVEMEGWGWIQRWLHIQAHTVYPNTYTNGFVVLCFVVVMQSFIMNSHEVFIHIHQGCFAGTGAIVRLPQCQWSKPDGYGKISQCITTTKHSKAKTVCIFLGIYCSVGSMLKRHDSIANVLELRFLCIKSSMYDNHFDANACKNCQFDQKKDCNKTSTYQLVSERKT